jgi:non-specific serine/threonine protein kinase
LLLQRLSVFAGGWTLEAAEAICAGDGIAPEAVLDLLAGLVAKSLALLEEGSAGARYRLLETVRQYARDRLEAAGEASRLQDRHLEWCQALAGQAVQRIGGAEREVWLARLETELENFRSALDWSLHSSEGNVAGATWALNYQGMVAMVLGDYQRATTLLEQVLPVHRQQGDLHGVGWALSHLAWLQHLQGDYLQAGTLFKESLAMFQELGDKYGIGQQLASLGYVARDQGDYGQAKRLYHESLRVRHALLDKPGLADSFEGLAEVAAEEGQPVLAARLFGAAHWLGETIGTPLHATARPAQERAVANARTALGEDAFAAAWAAGQAMELDDAVALALEPTDHGPLS